MSQLTLCFFIFLLKSVLSEKVTYTFQEFPYKESSKNVCVSTFMTFALSRFAVMFQENMFREVEAACEGGCLGKIGVSKVLCIRQCISPSCYRDLYQADLVIVGVSCW